MLGVALLASTAAAQVDVTVDAGAQTMVVPSFVAEDPAVGTYVIGTDGAQNGFYAYELTGAWRNTVITGLTRSADISRGVLAVAAPNAGILFFNEADQTVMLAPDGGVATIQLASVSMVALGDDGSGNLVVFANSGGTTLFSYRFGGDALPDVTLPAVPRGLAWGNGALYATITGAVVAVDGSGAVTTVISENVGSADGLTMVEVGNATYAFIASSSDSRVYVHRVSGTPAFIGTLTVKNGSATVTPKYVASNNAWLVLQDSATANYKIVDLTHALVALQLVSSAVDGGTPGGSDGGSGGPSGPGTVPGWGPSAPLNPSCSVGTPLLLLPAVLALLRSRRRRETAEAPRRPR